MRDDRSTFAQAVDNLNSFLTKLVSPNMQVSPHEDFVRRLARSLAINNAHRMEKHHAERKLERERAVDLLVGGAPTNVLPGRFWKEFTG